MAYFQAYSNTYANVEKLRALYDQAIQNREVIGLIIGTRPDCVNTEILDLLSEYNKKTFLTVEYGIESCYDMTLKKINRGHDFAETVKALKETSARGIRTGGHMIFGLPGENREDILHEAGIVSDLALDQVKFHQLQIVKGTLMGEDFQKNPELYIDYTLNDYLSLVADFAERLNPAIVIERIAGETVPQFNLRQSWGLRYDQVLNKFEQLLAERDSWQGKLYTEKENIND